MDTPFIIERILNAPINKVWQALTETDKMKVWYFPQLKEFQPVVGFEFDFSNDGSPYRKEWKVTAVEDGRKLAHSWAYKGYSGTSEVTFELFEEGDKTKILLTHTGLESFPADPHFARQRFVDGWTTIIGTNLKNYVERKG